MAAGVSQAAQEASKKAEEAEAELTHKAGILDDMKKIIEKGRRGSGGLRLGRRPAWREAPREARLGWM